jgi:hypothetical protein
MTERHARRRSLFALLLLPVAALIGCGGNSTDLRLQAIMENAVVKPDFRVRAYIPADKNTADIYLSDIPTERLLDPADALADAVGSVVHIHMFLTPVAGSTPIDATACNATVRQVVLAGPLGTAGDRPALGVYGGGGFLLPDETPGGRSFSGSLFDATLKLTHATPGFVDRLGAARMSGDFDVRRDDAMARAMAQRLADLLDAAPPVAETAEPAAAPEPDAEPPLPPTEPVSGEASGGAKP